MNLPNMLENTAAPAPLESVRFVGEGLRRPECVLCTETGGIFASHLGAGVMHILPSGEQRTIGRVSQVDGLPWIPNGIALVHNGGFLVANMGEGGGVWRLHADGRLEPFLLEIDGERLRPANFVFPDEQGRLWVTVTTRKWPLQDAFHPNVSDGYIAVIDDKGARIAADGLAFANELRIDAAYEFLYVAETFGRRIRRFRIGAGALLGGGETFAQFGSGVFPDGMAFDAEGGLWVTSIVSNRLIRIAPDGAQTVMLEEADPEYVRNIEERLQSGSLSREDILASPSRILKNISSIAFGGPDLRTIYLGSLGGDRIAVMDSPVPGAKPGTGPVLCVMPHGGIQ
jgi:sugar lactone lactonase YvrE